MTKGCHAEKSNLFRDNTMITKIRKTSDTRRISKKKPPKKPQKSHKITLIPTTENREGGRTVGSACVDTIQDLEKFVQWISVKKKANRSVR